MNNCTIHAGTPERSGSLAVLPAIWRCDVNVSLAGVELRRYRFVIDERALDGVEPASTGLAGVAARHAVLAERCRRHAIAAGLEQALGLLQNVDVMPWHEWDGVSYPKGVLRLLTDAEKGGTEDGEAPNVGVPGGDAPPALPAVPDGAGPADPAGARDLDMADARGVGDPAVEGGA